MIDAKEIEKKIRESINERRKLGEHSGGSGHLALRSITKFNLSELKEVPYEAIIAYEIICDYEIYTETEFLHPPEDDIYYTEHYRDKFIINKNVEILNIQENLIKNGTFLRD